MLLPILATIPVSSSNRMQPNNHDNNKNVAEQLSSLYTLTIYLSVLSVLLYIAWRLFMVWCRYMLTTRTFSNRFFTESRIRNTRISLSSPSSSPPCAHKNHGDTRNNHHDSQPEQTTTTMTTGDTTDNEQALFFQVEQHKAITNDGHELILQRIVHPKWCSIHATHNLLHSHHHCSDGHMDDSGGPVSPTTSHATLSNHTSTTSTTRRRLSSATRTNTATAVSSATTMTTTTTTTTTSNSRQVILLQHGLLETSGIFVIGDHSLAFRLANLGYDVWLGNNRTNHYGQGKFNKPEDFSFSIDELIDYDLPAMIDYITQHTGVEKIHFVGQSQGAGQCFGALSSQPSLKSKLNKCFMLSPALFLRKQPNQWLLRLLMATPGHWFGDAEFMPIIPMFQRLMPKLSVAYGGNLMMKAMGFIEKSVFDGPLDDRYKVFVNVPSGCTSVNNLLHWFELLRIGGCIRRFKSNSDESSESDYQVEEMLNEWQDLQPSSKIHVFLGGRDSVVDPERTRNCFKQYSSFCTVHTYEEYGHTDFVWSTREVVTPIYDKILSILQED